MTNPPDIRSAAVADIIGAAHHGRRLGGWQVFSVVILLGLLGWWWLAAGHEEDRVSYQTDVLTRGTLVVQVSATGNLQPTNQVDVGSELSGTMQSVAVDANDQVTRGQVLARCVNLSEEGKASVLAYELANKQRKGIIEALNG